MTARTRPRSRHLARVWPAPQCELLVMRLVEVAGAGPQAAWGHWSVVDVGAAVAPSCYRRSRREATQRCGLLVLRHARSENHCWRYRLRQELLAAVR
jgi:hypothetical protein